MSALQDDFLAQAEWAADTSPLYERLCRIVADDPELLDLAATVPDDRAQANVFLAAVHRLVRSSVDHPLAEYYPSVTDDPRTPDDALAEALRSFCETYAEDLRPLLSTRRTQTNAVRRSAVLYQAFAHVATRTDRPLALVEIGPSAGLNLAWDRFRYEYETDADGRDATEDDDDFADTVETVGPADAPVTIRSRVRDGQPPLPEEPPAVHSRAGIDLNPLDVTDGADVEWLHALTWPEHHDRRALLSDAIDVARRDPPRLIEGDVLDELPAVLDEIPDDVPVVVYSTLVLYQVPEAVQTALRNLIADAATGPPVHWLTGSHGFDDPSDGLELHWHRGVDGDLVTDPLATFQHHGEWIDWHGGE